MTLWFSFICANTLTIGGRKATKYMNCLSQIREEYGDLPSCGKEIPPAYATEPMDSSHIKQLKPSPRTSVTYFLFVSY